MKYFCPLPFSHLQISSDNTYSPCCKIKKNISIDSMSPIKWFNSEYMEELRNSFRSDQKHPDCHLCWKAEDNNLLSLRQKKNKEFKLYKISHHDPQIKSVEINLTNICNLGCLMCTPSASSYILAENRHLKIQFDDQKKYNWNKNNNKSMIELLNQPTLKVINIHGGETFINKKIFQLISSIDNDRKSQLILDIITNATHFDKKWYDLLSKFRIVRFTFSIDATDGVYEYMRYPANWKKVKSNIKNMMSISNAKGNSVNTVVQNLNILNLEPIIDFCQEKNLYLFLTKLNNPKYLEFTNLTEDYKNLAITRLEKIQKKEIPDHIKNEISSFIEMLHKSNFDKNLWNQFLQTIKIKDNFRNQNVFDILK